MRITVANRGPEAARTAPAAHDVVPQHMVVGQAACRSPHCTRCSSGPAVIELNEPHYGKRWLCCEGSPELLFTENETNTRRLYGVDEGVALRQGRHQRLRRARRSRTP